MVDTLLAVSEKLMEHLVPELTKHSMTLPQFVLLGFLRDEDKPLAMHEIAIYMQHTTAATTGMIDRMHQLGLVKRTMTRTDRRVILVGITTQGKRILKELSKTLVEWCKLMLTLLTPEEKTAWISINYKILGLLENQPLTFEGVKKISAE